MKMPTRIEVRAHLQRARALLARVRAYRATRIVTEVLLSPFTVGALWVLGLSAWAGRRGGSDDTDLGDLRRAEAVALFVERRFSSEVTRMKLGIAATAIGVGLVVGLVADGLFRLRGTEKRTLWKTLVVVAGLHGSLMFWSMARSPQLYAASWYARGGMLRTAQVLVTDVLGTRGVLALVIGFVVMFVRPYRIVGFVRSLRFSRKIAMGAVVAFLLWPPSLQRLEVREASAAGTSGSAQEAKMNVLLIAADSLRADRIVPSVAPNISHLADRSARFDRTYVSIPRTFPSWVTILTGRHPHHHGVRSMFPTWEDRAKDFDALPSRLSRAGYSTGVVSDYAGDIFGRIDLGFGRVDTPSFDFRQLIRQRALERETPLLPVLHSQLGRRLFPVMRELADAADPMLLAEDVDASLGRLKDKPFFLTVFFSTAHFPYAAPAPFYAKYTDPSYRGRFKYHKPVGLGDEAPPDEADVRQVQGLYDGAVAAIDDAVGHVLGTLAALHLDDKTIVIVTADHGENIYELGRGQGHGDHLFGDAGNHVPLIIHDPRLPMRRTAAIARDVDIAPTLYELTGVQPPNDLDGKTLVPSMHGQPLDPRFAYAETELWFTESIQGVPPSLRMPYPGIMGLTEIDQRHNAEIVLRRDVTAPTLMARHRMVRDDRWKLVYAPTRTGVRYMLFDTLADPDETRDVAAAKPEQVGRLSAELWSWMLKDPLMERRNGYLVPKAGQ